MKKYKILFFIASTLFFEIDCMISLHPKGSIQKVSFLTNQERSWMKEAVENGFNSEPVRQNMFLNDTEKRMLLLAEAQRLAVAQQLCNNTPKVLFFDFDGNQTGFINYNSPHPIKHIQIMDREQKISVVSNTCAKIYDINTGQEIFTFLAHSQEGLQSDSLQAAYESSDGKQIWLRYLQRSVGNGQLAVDGHVNCYDSSSGRLVTTKKGAYFKISDNGTMGVLGSSGFFHDPFTFSTVSLESDEQKKIAGDLFDYRNVVVSPNTKYAAFSSSFVPRSQMMLYDCQKSVIRKCFGADQKIIRSPTFNEESDTIAVGVNGYINFFDTRGTMFNYITMTGGVPVEIAWKGSVLAAVVADMKKPLGEEFLYVFRNVNSLAKKPFEIDEEKKKEDCAVM